MESQEPGKGGRAASVALRVLECMQHHQRYLNNNIITPLWWLLPLTQAAFHARIAFCLDLHNEAVKAMRFEPDAHK
jgi:26S proteasome regulatory subunit N3